MPCSNFKQGILIFEQAISNFEQGILIFEMPW
jgi:hypothetical protein